MMVRNHDRPLIDRGRVPGGPSNAPVDNGRPSLTAAVHVRAGQEGIRDDGVHARVIGHRPVGVAVARDGTRDGHRNALAAEPQQHLPLPSSSNFSSTKRIATSRRAPVKVASAPPSPT
jgi:hypothetical protein